MAISLCGVLLGDYGFIVRDNRKNSLIKVCGEVISLRSGYTKVKGRYDKGNRGFLLKCTIADYCKCI